MTPLVSILIPAYNAEEWIADTIQSALAQTWPRKEVIVVDDGSKDQTAALARRFASAQVAVVTQENQGAAAARNRALALYQGDYIQWLDADDLLAPDKIERQMQARERCKSRRTLLSGAWSYFRYRVSKAEPQPSSLWCDLSPVDWLIRKMQEGVHMQTDNWLVSRELTEAAGPWDIRLFRDNDGEYFCRVLLASDGTCFVPEAKSYYRLAGFSSVSYIGRNNKKLDSLFTSMQLHVKYLLSIEDSPRTRAACLSYFDIWAPQFYPHRLDLIEKLQMMAADLGGDVRPRLPWKYAIIQKAFGWELARRAQLFIPWVKDSISISLDRALYRRESKKQLKPIV